MELARLGAMVVNCFQFINFVNDSQSQIKTLLTDMRCELLSVH